MENEEKYITLLKVFNIDVEEIENNKGEMKKYVNIETFRFIYI